MSSSITATADHTYGTINGYTDAASGSQTGSIIDTRTSDIIQFVNVEPSPVNHSAVGFPNATSFPSVPYAFQSAAQLPQATAISTSQSWSTGLVPSQGGSGCYSQQFTVPSIGTYYFGDYSYYNLASFEFRVGYGVFTASARWPILRCGLKEEKSNLPAIKNKTVRIVVNLV